MLSEVRVRDLALLENVDLALSPRLNVLSGETGEGKSLLLQALMLLLGQRARRGLVRQGCKEAVVEGRFLLSDESQARIASVTDLVPTDAEELCLRRVILEDGSSRAYLDGSFCPVGLLAKVGSALVDVHGQGGTQSLQRSSEQRLILDRFGGHEGLVTGYRALHAEATELAARLERWDVDVQERVVRLRFLQFQHQEISELGPTAGEESELASELRLLSKAGDVRSVLESVVAGLLEDEGATGELCARSGKALFALLKGHAAVDALALRLQALAVEAQDVAGECAALRDDLTWNPERLEEVEDRLGRLRRLAARHGVDADDLAAKALELEGQIGLLDVGGEQRDELLERKERALAELARRGKALWEARRSAGSRLEEEVATRLRVLKMERARFGVRVAPEVWGDSFDPLAASSDGPGPVDFVLAANPGEPEQRLQDAASGGEMARVLLAIKAALAGTHRIPLLIFDEIDSGVGGRVGLPFGRCIAQIAAHHQVLLVTHLPQVAAFADRHFRVKKKVARGRTVTKVEVLAARERVDELAEMLGGGGAMDAAREQAEALIREAAS